MYLTNKIDIQEFNDSVNIDYFFTDFQFYPINTTILSLLNREAELLESLDNLSVKKLYYYDFTRIERLGKEYSHTYRINGIWEKLNEEYFYISPTEVVKHNRIESKGYGKGNEDYIRHKFSLRYLDEKILEIIYTKLEKTIEIRSIKIRYYESVLRNTELTMDEIKQQMTK